MEAMIDEKVILQVLAEQKEEIESYKTQKWVARKEESLFELSKKNIKQDYVHVSIAVKKSEEKKY